MENARCAHTGPNLALKYKPGPARAAASGTTGAAPDGSVSRCELSMPLDSEAAPDRADTFFVEFLESTFTDQNNPKRQTADPLWDAPKLDL